MKSQQEQMGGADISYLPPSENLELGGQSLPTKNVSHTPVDTHSPTHPGAASNCVNVRSLPEDAQILLNKSEMLSSRNVINNKQVQTGSGEFNNECMKEVVSKLTYHKP